MSSPLPITGPLSLGDLLDRAFRLYRARFWPLTLVGALFMVPMGVLSGFLSGQSMTSLTDAVEGLSRPGAPPDSFGPIGNYYGSWFITFLLMSLTVSLAQLAMTTQSIAALRGETLSLGGSIRAGFRRLLPYVGLNIVQWLAIFGAMIVAYIPLFCVAFTLSLGIGVGLGDESAPAAAAAAGGMAIIAVGCLTVVGVFAPMVYLLARWLVAMPSLVNGAGPVEALRESWRLTKGNVWRAVLYTFLLYVLSLIVTGLPSTALQWLITLTLGPRQLALATALSQGVGSIISVLWLPVYVAGLVLLYYDLRVRHEGYDLALRIEQLEAEVNATARPALSEGGSDA